MMDIKEALEIAFKAGDNYRDVFEGSNTDKNFNSWFKSESTQQLVKNIAVLDGVSVTPDDLRSMAKKLLKKQAENSFETSEEYWDSIDDCEHLDRVAELLEQRNVNK